MNPGRGETIDLTIFIRFQYAFNSKFISHVICLFRKLKKIVNKYRAQLVQ